MADEPGFNTLINLRPFSTPGFSKGEVTFVGYGKNRFGAQAPLHAAFTPAAYAVLAAMHGNAVE
jgi:hypothetical protein